MAVTTQRPAFVDDRSVANPPRRLREVTPVGSAIRRTRPTWERAYQRRLVLTDCVILAVALLGSQALWLGVDTSRKVATPVGATAVPYSLATIGLFALWLGVLKVYGTRSSRVIGSGFTEYTRIADASFRLFGLVGIAALLLQFLPARGYILTAFPLGVALLIASRWLWRQWLRKQRSMGRYLIRVLLVGSPASVEHVQEEFARRKYLGFELVGACLPRNTPADARVAGLQRLGYFDEVATVARRERVHAVALAGSEDLPPDAVRRIGWKLESTGVDLMVAPAITEVAGTRIHTRPVGGMPLMYVDSPSYEGGKKTSKALLDCNI